MFSDHSMRYHLIQSLIISGHDSSKYLCLTAETKQTTSDGINNACLFEFVSSCIVIKLLYQGITFSSKKCKKLQFKNLRTATILICNVLAVFWDAMTNIKLSPRNKIKNLRHSSIRKCKRKKSSKSFKPDSIWIN